MGSIQEAISSEPLAPVKVLIIGGSYGGLAAALNLLDLCQGKTPRFDSWREQAKASERPQSLVQIKIVDERDGFYHLIGSPLALASKEYSEKAWIRYQDIPTLKAQELSHAQGSVTQVDLAKKVARITNSKTKDESEENYDYLIAASGAVGIEMAAEIKVVEPTQKVALIHSRRMLLSSEPLPDDCKDQAFVVLKASGVEVIMGQRVEETTPLRSVDGSSRFDLTLSNGSRFIAGHIITALSKSIPTSDYLPKDTLDEEGLVKITSNLHIAGDVPNAAHHYAIGDLASWSGIKRCGGAMHMGYMAATNIHQQILQQQTGRTPEYLVYPEMAPMIALAMGKNAVVYDPEGGTRCGEDVMKMFFGDDLGHSICWNYMQLSNDSSVTQKTLKQPEQISQIVVAPVEV